MKPLRDPEKAELRYLVSACDLRGKTVLEIGCGDGVFTRQYARLPLRTVGLDPIGSELQAAMRKARSTRTLFLQGEGENLPFSAHSYDIVLFASSL